MELTVIHKCDISDTSDVPPPSRYRLPLSRCLLIRSASIRSVSQSLSRSAVRRLSVQLFIRSAVYPLSRLSAQSFIRLASQLDSQPRHNMHTQWMG